MNKIINNILNNEKDNIVFSPFSLLLVLQMLENIAKGDTKDKLNNYVSNLNVNNDKNLKIANIMAINENLYHSIDHDVNNIEIMPYDVDKINKLVSKKTKGMINNIVDKYEDVSICLLNALYFKDKWEKKITDITNDVFVNSDRSISEVMMLNNVEYEYMEDDHYIGFCKAYKHNYKFIALLPKDETFENVDILKLYHNRTNEEVHVSFPEFNAESSIDLTDILMKTDLKIIFSNEADFSLLGNIKLVVTSIMQKTVIEVSDIGTKAASVTKAIMCMSLPRFDYKIVRIDRPFIYGIIDVKNDQLLFAGRINKLLKE